MSLTRDTRDALLDFCNEFGSFLASMRDTHDERALGAMAIANEKLFHALSNEPTQPVPDRSSE